MSIYTTTYDVIVIGGGHAGSEAAAAAANLGAHTLLITMSLQNIAQMSCNPAMGGIAKGQIVREIDALGGYSGIITDKTAIQFKMLNKSKGPAMWSPRAQSDRMRFAEEWRYQLENIDNLDMFQDAVNGLLFDGDKIIGVKTTLGIEIKSKTVIVTAGTFLNGLIHIGEKTFGGGRAGESASTGITEDLVEKGFESGRMKTGTPPRVDARSLDFSKMIEQPGDENPVKFSYLKEMKPLTEQRSCYMTYTSLEVHNLLREGFDRSPMFSGRIKSTGPRYCPSIEDKIDRFASKERHQIFVEPEGWKTNEIYVNGFSTSLPDDIQDLALRKVAGFENVKFLRYGYAIEYDYFPPTQLKHSLETKLIKNLYFAGQINGTTGYEEAGAQGLMAGINAALNVQNKEPFILRRDEAYIGVLIDDLITKGTDEPYRMFTSRAEYRTLLRQDNADLRLTKKGFELGLASQERMDRVIEKQEKTDLFVQFLKETSLRPEEINGVLEEKGTAIISQPMKIIRIASRPQISFDDLKVLPKLTQFILDNNIDFEIEEQAEIHIKYAGYIARQQGDIDRLKRNENTALPEDID
ncbi:MAG: tRNA uridine-5-carboxymethylaminomethyl(34) synthesis enzyme MnmG, partial [Flavobacteriaceae bacterium]